MYSQVARGSYQSLDPSFDHYTVSVKIRIIKKPNLPSPDNEPRCRESDRENEHDQPHPLPLLATNLDLIESREIIDKAKLEKAELERAELEL
jgi:hypothetical protein